MDDGDYLCLMAARLVTIIHLSEASNPGRGAQWLTMGPILAQEASTLHTAPVMPALYAFVPA